MTQKRLYALGALLVLLMTGLAGCFDDDAEDVREEREDLREEQDGAGGDVVANENASAEGGAGADWNAGGEAGVNA